MLRVVVVPAAVLALPVPVLVVIKVSDEEELVSTEQVPPEPMVVVTVVKVLVEIEAVSELEAEPEPKLVDGAVLVEIEVTRELEAEAELKLVDGAVLVEKALTALLVVLPPSAELKLEVAVLVGIVDVLAVPMLELTLALPLLVENTTLVEPVSESPPHDTVTVPVALELEIIVEDKMEVSKEDAVSLDEITVDEPVFAVETEVVNDADDSEDAP